MRKPSVRFVDTSEQIRGAADLLVATCGYEERARYIAETAASCFTSVVAFTYPTNRKFGFDDNYEYFKRAGTVLEPATMSEFSAMLASVLRENRTPDRPTRIAIDISSVDRERLACIIDVLYGHATEQEISVEFLYAMGAFESHSTSSFGTVMVNEPLPGFEGWTSDPGRPVACVIGLGFENLIALAALETLEPARTVAFVARSEDPRFNERVIEDNRPLISDQEVLVVEYDIGDPLNSLQSLEDVVHALRHDHRVVLVPLGPKMFALLTLLVALEYRDEITVWRVSGGQSDEIEDRKATGQMASLRLLLAPDAEGRDRATQTATGYVS